MESVDVLVVGAGPSGSTVAHEVARTGARVLVTEEHPRVGHPVQCAGLVSRRVLDLAGTERMVLGPVHGASVFGPSLGSIAFKAPEPRAFVIDRAGLDIHLAERAAVSGAEYRTGWRFDGFAEGSGDGRIARFTRSDGTSSEVRARVVVGADGVASAVARAARLRRRVEILPAFEAEIPSSPGDPDAVEVYLGNRISPGLFGWWVPNFSGGARVGVACTPDGTSARTYFDRLIALLERRFGQALPSPVGYVVSGIPIGTLPHLTADRVVLVGDAAAQVKPLSGGGIFTGMRAGALAARTIVDHLGHNQLDARTLSEYARAFDAEIGEEFRRAAYLRRLFLRLSDDDFDRLITVLQESGLSESIVAFGDIDFPSHVARKLLVQSPALLRLFPKAVGAWLSSGGVLAPDLDEGPPPRRSAR